MDDYQITIRVRGTRTWAEQVLDRLAEVVDAEALQVAVLAKIKPQQPPRGGKL